jgi:hypothetical protein
MFLNNFEGYAVLEEKNVFVIHIQSAYNRRLALNKLISELKDTQARVWDQKKAQKVIGEY